MNWADWIIVAILSVSSVIGLIRGFFKEVFSLLIWVVAIVLATLYSGYLEQYLRHIIETPSLRTISAFVAIFVVVLLVGTLISVGLDLLVKASGLSLSNRLLGMGFGFARGLFFISMLLIYLPSFISVKKDPWFQKSLIIAYVAPYEAVAKSATTKMTQWLSKTVNS